MICAVAVDAEGHKHVLGFREGATENAEVAKALLEDLVSRGLSPLRKRLFVIDGSKAFHKAIDQVFGKDNPIERCRNHKLRNVLGHLPQEQHDQARATLKAAWKLDADAGMQKVEQYASWFERNRPSAAASLRGSLGERFTIPPPRSAFVPETLPGIDEPDRQQPLGAARADAPCQTLA